MEAMGIVRRSSSPWSSPLHVVPKPSGGWRPCGEYRRLYTVTVDDRYPVPRLQDFTATLTGKTIFSKIDSVRAYHQVVMTPNDIHKTAATTPFGLYEFLRMPFGLKTAAQAFQRLMDKVCQGLARVFVYLDDILVASEDRHQHLRDLTELFGRLEDHGIVIKRTKCVLGVSSIDFLGHHVNAKGIVPLLEKVRAIRDFPRPSTVKGIQEFLVMINFYHRFVPHVAEIFVPMHAALAGRKRLVSLVWTPEMENAFTASKNALADAQLNDVTFVRHIHGCSTPVVPALFRRRVFDTVHGLSHPGIRTTQRLLTSKFVWPRIAADAASWARACIPCQQSKVNRHIRAPVANFRPPSRRFSRVHVDVVGPLPSSQGFRISSPSSTDSRGGRKPFR